MTPPVPHRAVSTVLTLVVPLALAAVPLLVAGAWASELPDPVAVHFTADGPDGFSSLAGAVWPRVRDRRGRRGAAPGRSRSSGAARRRSAASPRGPRWA